MSDSLILPQPVSEKLAAVPLYMGYPCQVLPLPLHKDFISLGVQPRLGRTDKLWLGSLCPGDIPCRGSRVQLLECATHNHCSPDDTTATSAGAHKDTLSFKAWRDTNQLRVCCSRYTKGKNTSTGDRFSPNFPKYVLNIWFMPYSCVKFRAAETQHFQKSCLISSVGRHFSLKREKDQRKI